MIDIKNISCGKTPELTSKLSSADAQELLTQLKGWEIIENHHLLKKWKFEDFKTALSFVNKVGECAEKEGHHPNISFTWGSVGINIWTHKVEGITANDFILAYKINAL